MNFLILLSDQLYMWSDIHAKYFIIDFTQTPNTIVATNASLGLAFTRFAYRTLQALRKTWLQVCRWPRPWPQILFIGQLPGQPTANGLRAANRSTQCCPSHRKLPPGPPDHRRNLRDQPRIATSPRGVLREFGESVATISRAHRPTNWWRTYCQYARSMARCRGYVRAKRGGRQ